MSEEDLHTKSGKPVAYSVSDGETIFSGPDTLSRTSVETGSTAGTASIYDAGAMGFSTARTASESALPADDVRPCAVCRLLNL